MSVELEPRLIEPAIDSPRRYGTIVSLAIVLGPLPLVVTFFVNLWGDRPHYQFFPLYLAALAWLLWTRRPLRWPGSAQASRWETIFLLAGFSVFALAVLVFSPWLGVVAWLLLTAGVLMQAGGGATAQWWLPVWAITWLVVPPPLQWDVEFLQWLRGQTSRATGVVLDALGVIHVQTGNTFEVPGYQFFVHDACSGIHSLLALLSVSALWSVYGRLPLLAALCSMACAALAAVLLNILRVICIILAYTHWGMDLSIGWRHELLGLVLFGMSLTFLWSANQLWLFCFSLVPTELHDSDSSASLMASQPTVSVGELATPPVRFQWRTVMAGCALLLWFPQLGHVARNLHNQRLLAASLSVASPALAMTEHDLPRELHGWPRRGFKAMVRDRHSLEGEFSRQWTYQAPFGMVHVAFDFPFEGAHPLLRCYKSTGWDSTVIQTVAAAAAHEANTGGFQEVNLKRREFEEGFLLFSLWDDNGKVISLRSPAGAVAPPQPLLTRLWNRVLPKVQPGISISSTTYQLQVLIVSEFPLSDPDRATVRQMFLEVRDQFRVQFRTTSDPVSKGSASRSNDN